MDDYKISIYGLIFENKESGRASWMRFKTNKMVVDSLKDSLKKVGIKVSLGATKYRGCKNPDFS